MGRVHIQVVLDFQERDIRLSDGESSDCALDVKPEVLEILYVNPDYVFLAHQDSESEGL